MMQEGLAIGQPLRTQLPELDAVAGLGPGRGAGSSSCWGDGRYLELRVFTIQHDDGKLFGHVVLVRDITQLKADAMALEQANLLREHLLEIEQMRLLLQEQVVRDPLTGLFNRRFLDEMLEKQMRLAARHGTLVTVVMIDIDPCPLASQHFLAPAPMPVDYWVQRMPPCMRPKKPDEKGGACHRGLLQR